MKDDNWELINGEQAHIIEVLNYANQVNVIEAFLRYNISRFGFEENGSCKGAPDQYILRELHRTATLFLLAMPGSYRDGPVEIVAENGKVVHFPPPADKLESYLGQYFAELIGKWGNMDAIEIAAFTLWFINWIHPFKNGNGRTARAFSYAAMSLKLGFILPGYPTVIDLVMQNRPEYNAALNEADRGLDRAGKPDLSRMNRLMESLLEA